MWVVRVLFSNNPIIISPGDVTVTIQKHLSGTSHTTGYAIDKFNSSFAVVTMSMSNVSFNSDLYVVGEIKKARAITVDALQQLHSAWWNQYYAISFMSFSQV